MKNRTLSVLFLLLTAIACSVHAQILPPNAAGVAAGHAHIYVIDQAASNKFWTALGGVPLEQAGTFPGIKFPGVILLFAQTTAPRGGGPVTAREGSDGSVVEFLGFKVKNLGDALAKLDAVGVHPITATATIATVLSPEKIRVKLVQVAALPTPVASDEVAIKTPNAAASAAWYAKWFGADSALMQNGNTVAQIPGWNLRFIETKDAMAGMRGRALDHIGFDVPSVNDYIKKLGDGGVSVTPFAGRSPIGFVADPWGVSIELNEGVRNMK